MSNQGQKDALIVAHKKGVPIYASNPSIPNPDDIKKKRAVKLGNDKKGVVIDGHGEILGQGAAAFYEFEEVDTTRFVKLFLAGMKQATGLSKAGMSLFEIVYLQMQNNPNKDRVEINFYLCSDYINGLTERTYHRGLKELLDGEFLFRSTSDSLFYVNIRYMFNGDRLAFIKGYQHKPTKNIKSLNQDDVVAINISYDQ